MTIASSFAAARAAAAPLLACALALVLACGGSTEVVGTSGSGSATGSGGAGSTATASSGPGGAGSAATTTSATTGATSTTSTGPSGVLAVSPSGPTLAVTLPQSGQELPFQCLDTGTSQPVAGATWSLDTTALGAIDASGVFTPNAAGTGAVLVTCAAGGESASTSLELLLHAIDDPALASQGDKTALGGPPGLADPAWQMLYPYDQTVFPRGIPAPEVHMTQGSSPGSLFGIHISVGSFAYDGYFSASPFSTQLAMSEAAWEALTASAKGQTVQVEVSKLVNGQKYGPVARQWKLADGELHGVVYYTTYDSPLAGQNGAVMRVEGGDVTPEVLIGDCTVCHSVSSDGTTLAAANHSGAGGTFDLSGGGAPPILWNEAELGAYAALYPKKGEVLVTQGAPGASWPPNTAGTSAQGTSALRTKTGVVVPNSGIEGYYAQTPSFSHDGSMLAFTDRSSMQVGQYWPGALAVMSFSLATMTFSDHQVLAVPPPGRQFSWPSFTPDGRWVLFQNGIGEDLATWSGNTGKILAVDVQTKQLVALSRLNGDGYVPQGARDEDKSYEPSVSPVPSGGYAWVVFTSRRTYGNKLTGSEYETKRLWVSALDLDAPPGADPSHPAFYLAGQELTSGNHRGTLSLGPCRAQGLSCSSGDQCCDGYCNAGLCGPADGRCSDEFEPCVTPAECCGAAMACINARCATP